MVKMGRGGDKASWVRIGNRDMNKDEEVEKRGVKKQKRKRRYYAHVVTR